MVYLLFRYGGFDGDAYVASFLKKEDAERTVADYAKLKFESDLKVACDWLAELKGEPDEEVDVYLSTAELNIQHSKDNLNKLIDGTFKPMDVDMFIIEVDPLVQSIELDEWGYAKEEK